MPDWNNKTLSCQPSSNGTRNSIGWRSISVLALPARKRIRISWNWTCLTKRKCWLPRGGKSRRWRRSPTSTAKRAATARKIYRSCRSKRWRINWRKVSKSALCGDSLHEMSTETRSEIAIVPPIAFLKDGRLEIDNNRSERSIKPFVNVRSLHFFESYCDPSINNESMGVR